jgi:uncharacterized protein involved in copper resistance
MRKVAPVLIALLLLGACGHKKKPVPQAEDLGAPQIATSLDDAGLPVDRSDQITAIDAATGDASGMPHDGGAAIAHTKTQSQKTTGSETAPPPDAPPLVAPPPPTIPSPAPAPN